MPKRRRVQEGPLKNVTRSVDTVREDFHGLERSLWESEREIQDLKEQLDKATALVQSSDAELTHVRDEVSTLKITVQELQKSCDVHYIDNLKKVRDTLMAEKDSANEKEEKLRKAMCDKEAEKYEVEKEVKEAWEKVEECHKKAQAHHCAEVTYIRTLLELLEPAIKDDKFKRGINATKHIALTETTRISLDIDHGNEIETGLETFRDVLHKGIQIVVRRNLINQARTIGDVRSAIVAPQADNETGNIQKDESTVD